jgi:signal transduction histidine kinase
MTIKRRLFISNNLMIIIPVVLCILFAAVMSLAMIGVFGNFGGRSLDDDRFYQAKASIIALDAAAQGEDELLGAVDGIAESNKSEHISVFIYKSGQPIGAPALYTPLLQTALGEAGTHTWIFDHTALFARAVDEYHIILMNTNYYLNDDATYRSYVAISLVMLLLIIATIVVTNRILTRAIVKNIMVPIDALSYGVEQIREGNLTFRLDYSGKDEFDPVCAAFNDMAERLQKLENMRRSDEANRKELIAGISHDLRTPLTSIKAYLEGIDKGVAESPERRQRYLGIIKSKTDDLEHIINQLFLFSKLDVGEFPMNTECLNIGRSVSEIAVGLADEYKDKGLLLELRPCPSDLFICADAAWLRNVIINILENSAKYKVAEIGRVIIECGESDGCVDIALTDDGPGVPGTALDKLFDVFYRTDPSRNTEGSGLGLAISERIVSLLGGRIFARLPQGGGLAVVLRFPVCQDERMTTK